MLSLRLREETRNEHSQLESKIDLRTFARDEARFVALLKAFYGYYLVIEKDLMRFQQDFTDAGCVISDRLKSELIRRDLETFGVGPAEMSKIALCESTPPMEKFSDAMGCLYVLEGSTLGGQVILKELTKANIVTDQRVSQFYAGYRERTMPMWMSFKSALDKLDEGLSEQVLSSARRTFKTLDQWLQANLM
ncbi:MAG TPA: biliverdin-producing heme oxygenase [Bacteriovoracaceae bacterium]|nr:biliverdin-producing heme oxygenase [Bacteriovoracaceae bacterium]